MSPLYIADIEADIHRSLEITISLSSKTSNCVYLIEKNPSPIVQSNCPVQLSSPTVQSNCPVQLSSPTVQSSPVHVLYYAMKNAGQIGLTQTSVSGEIVDDSQSDKNDATEFPNAPVNTRQLKGDRTSAKRALTKKLNEIKQLMLNPDNAPEIKQKMLHLETTKDKFVIAHKLLHETLNDEDDIHESNDYFSTKIERIADLKQNVEEWSERIAHQLDFADVQPEDSASNIGRQKEFHLQSRSQHSKVGSNVSNTSSSTSISISKAKATAKKARLQVQVATFRKKRALQEEQFRLERLAEELELETQLAMASAEERAYLEAENAMTNDQRKDGEEPVTTNLPQKRCEVQIQSYTPKSSVNEENLERRR